jgi:Ca2+-binding EF-hand superfamily protein
MAKLKAKKKKKNKNTMMKKFWARVPAAPPRDSRTPPRDASTLRRCLGMANNVYIQRPDAKEAVKALCLNQRQLKYLKKKFDEVDVDGSGTMDSTEFFGMLGEDRTPLTDALFGLMDLDGSGTIEFDEFVAVLLTYCMYSKDDILRFCFDTYDLDHSNSIDEQEFMALMSSVNNGTPMFPGNFTTVLQGFDSNDDGLIDFQEFKVIEQRYPLIFFPAFRLQEQMQKCTLGTSNWRNIHIAVNRQRFKNEHRRTHGRDPPVSIAECVVNLVLCRRNHEIDIDVIDSKKPSITSAQQAADKKKAILEGANRKKRPSRASFEDD